MNGGIQNNKWGVNTKECPLILYSLIDYTQVALVIGISIVEYKLSMSRYLYLVPCLFDTGAFPVPFPTISELSWINIMITYSHSSWRGLSFKYQDAYSKVSGCEKNNRLGRLNTRFGRNAPKVHRGKLLTQSKPYYGKVNTFPLKPRLSYALAFS